jgi:hypothetical protein
MVAQQAGTIRRQIERMGKMSARSCASSSVRPTTRPVVTW